jgi:hypothetical protein
MNDCFHLSDTAAQDASANTLLACPALRALRCSQIDGCQRASKIVRNPARESVEFPIPLFE